MKTASSLKLAVFDFHLQMKEDFLLGQSFSISRAFFAPNSVLSRLSQFFTYFFIGMCLQ